MEGKASRRLFECVEQRVGPAAQSESTFEFLQRGGAPEAIRVRTWMEHAFGSVAVNRRHALRQRLKARTFEGFIGTYLELQVHEMLRRRQCSFEYEPDEPESYPADFRITQGKDSFGIEATTFVREPRFNEDDFYRRTCRNETLKETLRLTRLSLNLRADGRLKINVPKKKINKFVSELCQAATNPIRLPGWEWNDPHAQIEVGEWRCEGRIWSSGGRGGFINPPSRFDDEALTCLAIREKLYEKQRRWGNYWKKKGLAPGHFLLATSVDFLVDLEIVEAALYGSPGSSQERRQFVPEFHRTNAVIVFHKAALGAELGASVQLYRNGDGAIPDSLRLLEKQQSLRDLIGM